MASTWFCWFELEAWKHFSTLGSKAFMLIKSLRHCSGTFSSSSSWRTDLFEVWWYVECLLHPSANLEKTSEIRFREERPLAGCWFLCKLASPCVDEESLASLAPPGSLRFGIFRKRNKPKRFQHTKHRKVIWCKRLDVLILKKKAMMKDRKRKKT